MSLDRTQYRLVKKELPRYICDACGKDYGMPSQSGANIFGPRGMLCFFDETMVGKFVGDHLRHFCDWSCVSAYAAQQAVEVAEG